MYSCKTNTHFREKLFIHGVGRAAPVQGTAVLLRYSSTAREEKVPATVSAERVCIPGAQRH